MKTLEYLESLMAKGGYRSYSALASDIGVTREAISAMRRGKVVMGDETAVTVAEMLHIDPAPILLQAHAERTRDEKVRAVWSKLAASISAGGFVVSSGQNNPPANAVSRAATPSPAVGLKDAIYIMSTNACGRLARFFFPVPFRANYT